MRSRAGAAFALALLGHLAGCGRIEPARTAEDALVEVAPDDWPELYDDLDFALLDEALAHSAAHFARIAAKDPARTYAFGRERVPVEQLARTVTLFREIARVKPVPGALREALRAHFRLFRSTGASRDGDVLFTGYYLPELRGALAKGGAYTVPLYRRPEDLVVARGADFPQLGGEDLVGRLDGGRLFPYATRREIRTGALAGRGLELVWVDSAVDAFFVEIQGSGLVRLPDGTTRVVTYDGKNGHRYFAVGAELVRRGVLEKDEVSMQTIRAWLEAHPEEQAGLFDLNPSAVFFRLEAAAEGSLGFPVTAGRSIATDTRVFPKGALAFIRTERPASETSEDWVPFSRFVADQDTGGAIRTAARVDVYWGSGAYAAHAAGRMKQNGRLYYLLAR